MNKTICDICKENEADKNYKFKEFDNALDIFGRKTGWKYIDICPTCYENLKTYAREPEDVGFIVKAIEEMREVSKKMARILNGGSKYKEE